MWIETSAGAAEVEWAGTSLRGDKPSPRRRPRRDKKSSDLVRFLLVLTHGSGGDIDAKDLLAVRDVAVGLGAAVALVRQPYRVAGRRAPGAAGPQDAAWLEVVAALRAAVAGVPLIDRKSVV